jgi:hypothetical protein
LFDDEWVNNRSTKPGSAVKEDNKSAEQKKGMFI